MQMALAGLAGVLGLVVGSFANVPIHRWPRGASVTQPRRSACPACGVGIRAIDNVPVASWLALRGRCRDCQAPIPARYLAVEALTGALFVAVVWRWGADPLLPALLVLAWAMVVAGAIDLEHRIIPNRLTLRLPAVLLPLVGVAAAMEGQVDDLRRAVIAGLAIPAAMFALSELFRLFRGQAGIGMGDIKLAVSIGIVVGYLGGLEIAVFAYGSVISAVLIAAVLMAAGRARLASRIPFGPYLAIGAMAPILAGDALTGLLAGWLGV